MTKTTTREQQRQSSNHRLMVGIGLNCHLRNLINEIKAGDVAKVNEFQQYVQYAPTALKIKLLGLLDDEPEDGDENDE